MNDTYKHKGLRKKLVEELREKGIKDENVLRAIETVPRHLFLDEAFLEYAYKDTAFKIGAGQTISHPHTVAFQSELLEIKKRRKGIRDRNRFRLSNQRINRVRGKSIYY